MQNYKPSIKEVSKHQETPSRRKTFFYILLGIGAFCAPFIHLYCSREKNDLLYNKLGFDSYYTLFFAIGFPLFIFFISFFFYVFSKELKSYYFKRFAIVLGFGSQLLALFFIVWSLFPRIDLENGDIDFPRYLYKVFSFIIALILSYAFYSLYKYFSSEESRFVKLFNHVLYTRTKVVYPLAKEDDFEKRKKLVNESDQQLEKTLNEVL